MHNFFIAESNSSQMRPGYCFFCALLACLIFSFAGCSSSPSVIPVNDTGNASVSVPAVIPVNILGLDPMHREMVDEVLRLQQVSLRRNLSRDDLIALDNLTISDTRVHGEYLEAVWMMDHGYGRHVEHSINSMYYILTTGTWLCSADSLSHVGVFLKYDELQMAKDSLEEGNRTLVSWEEMAQSTKSKNPETYPGLNDLLLYMHKEIDDFTSGNISATEQDAAFLDQNGYC